MCSLHATVFVSIAAQFSVKLSSFGVRYCNNLKFNFFYVFGNDIIVACIFIENCMNSKLALNGRHDSIEVCTAALSSFSDALLLGVVCFFLLLEAETLNASSASRFRLLSVASSTGKLLNISSDLCFKLLRALLLVEGKVLANDFSALHFEFSQVFFSKDAVLNAFAALQFNFLRVAHSLED